MAIHDSVLLGAMSQSVDNLTMCVCRKLRIVRHKAKHVTNPRTDKQRVQRAKMKATIELAQAFAPIAKIGFPAMAAGQTGYNGFVIILFTFVAAKRRTNSTPIDFIRTGSI